MGVSFTTERQTPEVLRFKADSLPQPMDQPAVPDCPVCPPAPKCSAAKPKPAKCPPVEKQCPSQQVATNIDWKKMDYDELVATKARGACRQDLIGVENIYTDIWNR